MRGGDRKSKSTREHIEAGTFRKERHSNRIEARQATEFPIPPVTFDKSHVAKWNEVCGWLQDFEILASQDYDTIRIYVETELTQRKAWNEYTKTGTVIETKHGPKVNPAWRIYLECEKILKPIREKFGFSPRDRQGIKVEKPKTNVVEDPIAELLKSQNLEKRAEA